MRHGDDNPLANDHPNNDVGVKRRSSDIPLDNQLSLHCEISNTTYRHSLGRNVNTKKWHTRTEISRSNGREHLGQMCE